MHALLLACTTMSLLHLGWVHMESMKHCKRISCMRDTLCCTSTLLVMAGHLCICVTARMGSSSANSKASHPCFVSQKLQTTGFVVQALLIKHGLNSFADRLWLSRWEDIVDLKLDAFLDCGAVICHSSACTHYSSGLTTAACYSATRTCRHSRRQDGAVSAEMQRLHDACEYNRSHPSSSCNLLQGRMDTTRGAVPPVECMCRRDSRCRSSRRIQSE